MLQFVGKSEAVKQTALRVDVSLKVLQYATAQTVRLHSAAHGCHIASATVHHCTNCTLALHCVWMSQYKCYSTPLHKLYACTAPSFTG